MNTKVSFANAISTFVSSIFTHANTTWLRLTGLLFVLNMFSYDANAQCALGCNDGVQVSVDNLTCKATITVDMISPTAASSCPGGNFSVIVMNESGGILSTSPIVTGNEVGKRLNVKVLDNITGNSCWGSIVIEDKVPPVITCTNDTIPCNANINAVGVIKAPVVVDNCGATTLTYTDVMTDLPCSNADFTAYIVRTYTAKDKSGKTSTCEKYIYLRKGKLSDVVMPKNRDGVQLPTLPCNTTTLDPTVTGAPTIYGQPLTSMCDLAATYVDQVRDECAGSKVILRNWLIMDFCSSNAITYIQYIKTEDKTVPSLACPADVTIGTKATACNADYTIPNINVTDNCSPTAKITLSYTATNGVIVGSKITNLPLGVTTITVKATDDCNNSTSCTYKVTVRDNAPPVAVCAGLRRVSLGLDGMAELTAASFDDGSVDNCGIERFEVSRMTSTVSFGNTIKFSCQDSNDTIRVILRVWDANGNYNDCMTSVVIEDKLAPSIVCPADITMTCKSDYTNLTLTGRATATDNCNVTVTYVDVIKLNNCGVGTVVRSWTAKDKGGRSAACVQYIHLVNDKPFYINPNNNNDPNDDVTWPADFTGTTCGANLLPAVTGTPIVKKDECDQIAVTYEDTNLPAQSGGCKKVLRKWIIVDFCQFDPNTTPRKGYWEYTQTINITNSLPPTLGFECKDITIGLDDKDCKSTKYTRILTASDDCSDPNNLEWIIKIDLNNDGTYDRIILTGDISGDYPLGTNLVSVTIIDGCGNKAECKFNIIVKDTKKPTAVCHHGLSANLMASGMVALTAKMFDGGSYDNCTLGTDLTFGITPSTFTCSDIGPNLVTFRVTDKAGNTDMCTTYVEIQDNMGACPDKNGQKAAILGNVVTPANQGVEKVDIMIDGTASLITTSNVGAFALYKTKGLNYEVKPERNDDPLNGVSTFDIVKLTKHLLGTEIINDPYTLIAADVNRSNNISTADIIAIRRVILGLSNSFGPTQQSWRFVKKDYTFPNPTNPFSAAFPEADKMSLTNDMTCNFVGIKMGDLNGNAKPNSIAPSAPRTWAAPLTITADDMLMEAGKTYYIPLNINEQNLMGTQFTLKYNSDMIDLINIKEGNLPDMTNANFAVVENGTITTSWNTNQTIQQQATFATLVFKAKQDVKLSEVLTLNSEVAVAEAYSHDEEVMRVNLAFAKGTTNTTPDATKGITLYQNQPNPFSEATQIRFYLPEPTSATISVMDITGKVVYSRSGEFSSGIHSISLNKSELTNLTVGMFYYQLQTSKEAITKKMLIVE